MPASVTRPASRHSSEPRTPKGPDLMEEALAACSSGRMAYVNETTFSLRLPHVLKDEDDTREFDLAEYHLPDSRLMPASPLTADRTLAIATVLAIDCFLLTAGEVKDLGRSVANALGTLAKFWEWGRLQGIYRPSDWTGSHFKQLARSLGESLWVGNMQLGRRVEELIQTKPQASLLVRIDSDDRASIRAGVAQLLHTNLSVQELASVRKRLLTYAGAANYVEEWTPRRPTVSWLVQTLRTINLLVRIPKRYALRVVPFPDPFEQAKRLGAPNKRTKNLTVQQAVALLVHSYDWIHNKADAAIALVEEAGQLAMQLECETDRKARLRIAEHLWRNSTVRSSSESVLGFPVEMVRVSKGAHGAAVSVAHVSDMLMSAAFVLVAGLNARRKDEISHRKLGLTRSSMRVINDELGIYEGDFYIEKTFQEYVPYFVNQVTYEAFVVLCRLEDVHRKIERALLEPDAVPDPEHSLFWRRTYVVTRGALAERIWFAFQVGGSGASTRFVRNAMGGSDELSGTAAHMFRRFYAIIYLYRFEHADLLHLRYQLGHLNLDCTHQYVSDAVTATATDRIPLEIRRKPEEVHAAKQRDLDDLLEEIKAVAKEKLLDSIRDLIGGGPASGGFPALLLRLHRRMIAQVDYRKLDQEAQAKRLAAVVERRGHAIRPLSHNDCLAGQSAARSAKCAEAPGTGPAPENATAETCSRCPLSWVSVGHLEGQRRDLEMLDKELAVLPAGTLKAMQAERSRDNLQRTIWLHEARMGQLA